MIEINSLSKSYYSKKTKQLFYALNDISMTIENNAIIGFLGSNGAGKTTLIKTICGLISPTTGSVFIDGVNIKTNSEVPQNRIGVVLEGARNVYNFMSVQSNLEYFCLLNRIDISKIEDRISHLLNMLRLTDKRHSTVNSLSRGMQQKVAIMVAMLKDPDVLILDEPTLGLDIISQLKLEQMLIELAGETQKTLVISSHDLSLINKVCQSAAIFNHGRLIVKQPLSAFKNITENFFVCIKDDANILDSNAKNKLHPYLSVKEDGLVTYCCPKELVGLFPIENVIRLEQESSDLEEFIKSIEV